MIFKIGYDDLVRIIKAYDYDDFDASIIADYLDESCGEMDFTEWVWNALMLNSVVLKGGRNEALKYIDENLGCGVEDCVIHVSDFLGGVYIEW